VPLAPITKRRIHHLGFGSSYKTRWDCQSIFSFTSARNSPQLSPFRTNLLSRVNINRKLQLTAASYFTMASLLQGSAFVTGAASGESKLKAAPSAA
jgi:hypothetical protein